METRFPELVAGAGDAFPPAPDLLREAAEREFQRSFGVMEGDDEEILGRIGDVALGGEGAFLLDDRLNRVAFLSLDQGTATHVAGAGPGPGELSIARGMAAFDSVLVVGDERRVLHFYRHRPPSGWEWERDLRVDVAVLDLCAFPDGAIYVLGVSPERSGVIHELVGDTIVRSFGHPYRPPRGQPDEFLDFLMAEGRVVCDPQTGLVIFNPIRLPEITAFSRAGEVRWVSLIPAYRQMAIHEGADGSIALGLQGAVAEMHILEWAQVSPAGLIVQLGLYDEQSVRLRTPKTLDSLLLDPATGTLVDVRPLERHLVVRDDLSVLTFSNDPYPHVSW